VLRGKSTEAAGTPPAGGRAEAGEGASARL